MAQARRAQSPIAADAAIPLVRRRPAARRDVAGLQRVTAYLSLTEASLERLLALTGSYTDFVLSAADGSTAVRVGVQVASVPSAVLQLGSGVVLDWPSATLSRGYTRVALTRAELRLLAALVEAAPAPVSHAVLARRLWRAEGRQRGDWRAGSGLAVVVCSLRKRFRALGLPAAIRTKRGMGYSLGV